MYTHWYDTQCDCQGTDEDDYFEIYYRIEDVANDSIVDENTVYTSDATVNYKYIPVDKVEDYCNGNPPKTPSFMIYIEVKKWETYLGYPTECCSNRVTIGPKTCQQFYNAYIDCDVGYLN